MSGCRGEFFSVLKPTCVPILKLSTQPASPAISHQLIQLLDSLLATLHARSSALDDRLANYVFLPLSHLFRQQAKHPARLLELSVAVLAILIEKGWKSGITPDHLNQLFLLLLYILDPKPGPGPAPGPKPALPEELESQVLRSLAVLFRAAHTSTPASSSLANPSILPSLGHGIVVILHVTVTRSSHDIQLCALDALDAACLAIPDHETMAKFFPGIISSLARLLSPLLSRSQKAKVLVQSLGIFTSITVKVIGDMQTRHISHKPPKADSNRLDASWLKATSTQLVLALSGVTMLRNHPSENVRRALRRMCITFLDECHYSLRSGSVMLVETALVLLDLDEPAESIGLEELASIYPEIGDDIKSIVYAWLSSATRVIQQQSEDRSREREICNLFSGIKILQNLHLDSPNLIESFSITLRDVITAMMRSSKSKSGVLEEPTASRDQWIGNALVDTTTQYLGFKPPILEDEDVRETRSRLVGLLCEATTSSYRDLLADKLFALLQESDGDDQVSSYWLAVELLKANGLGVFAGHNNSSSELDALLDFTSVSNESGNASHMMLQELYQYSVDIVGRVSDTITEDDDPRATAIALEVIALTSVRMGEHFRPELIDVLYPVSTFLGSRCKQLQSHAVVALNTIATSCGYPNVAELIVDNVDYMLNTVALKLNALDISLTTTQVLRMMTRLSGPRLVPYMEDVADAIFAALENYHGYPVLVDGLFSVLREVAEQGSRAGGALLFSPGQRRTDHRKQKLTWTSIDEICTRLARRRERRQRVGQLEADEKYVEGHPSKPWKVLAGEEDEREQQVGYKEEEGKAPTSSYALLHRITSLTQHYLTSPAPQLRRSLLELVASVVPALATNEMEFLPLVNAVWPVIVEQLWDTESYVAAAACETLAALCEYAGDFLSSRFRTEWAQDLSNLLHRSQYGDGQVEKRTTGLRPGWRNSKRGILAGREGMGSGSGSSAAGRSPYSQAARRWAAAKKLLLAMVLYVRMDEDIFEDICWLLADELEGDEEVREALETRNDDAVWLVRYSRGMVNIMPPPNSVTGCLEFIRVFNGSIGTGA